MLPPPAVTFEVSEERRVADWLASGVAHLSGFVPPGHAATSARFWAAQIERLSAQLGERVEVDGARLLGERAALTGARFSGEQAAQTSLGGSCRLLPCADGWVAVSLPRMTDLELVPALVEGGDDDPWASVAGWARGRRAAQIVERARLLGLAISQVGETALIPQRTPDSPVDPRTRRRGRAPLVVDFSALWAGPLCANLLGLGGARVVKIESYGRLDGARRGDPRFYDLLHHDHESVCVDPARRSDRAALARLVEAADVVIEASRPRALQGWGLAPDRALARGAVWVSITGYGRAEGDRVGFGDDVSAGAGLVGWPDGPSGPPAFVGDAIADPLAGLAAAAGALAALTRGGGQLIDVAMSGVVAATLDGSTTLPATAGPAPPQARAVPGPARLPCLDTAAVLDAE